MIERLVSLVTGDDRATDRAEGDGLAAERRAAANDPAPDGGTAVADDPANAEASEPDEAVDDLVAAFPKNFHQVLHLTKAPLFVVDAEGNAVVWNEGMEELTGSDEAEARAAEEISTAWYHDGRRSMTLADKIIDTHAGRRAEATPTHREYDVERVGWVDFTLYQDESTFTDADGETRHIRFSAAPLYEDEEFVGVVEYVEDRTEDVRRQQDLEELVTELTATLSAVGEGSLDVRADPPELAHVEDDLLGVVDLLNGTLDRLEDTVSGVAEDSERLRSSTQSIADQAESITDAAAEQETALQEVAGEVSDMSASVEEIAATADGVSDSANAAVEKAETGSEAAAEAEGVMTEVAEATEGVVDDVEHLQEQVAEIDEVVEVIDDIAEQTNMLALNASIEAARADTDGDGFAVVAEEVKQLAGESQEYADEIDRMVRSIQADTDRTVERLRTVNDQVHRGRGEVRTVQESIDAVVTDMDETAGGIAQVAAVTDDQADSAETVAAVIDDVVEAAEEIADSVENIAAQNTEHAELADGIDASLAQLTDDHRRD